MNTKTLSETIMETLDGYKFITEYPFDADKLRGEIESAIIRECLTRSPYQVKWRQTTEENRRNTE